jgi:hypothetical protein
LSNEFSERGKRVISGRQLNINLKSFSELPKEGGKVRANGFPEPSGD